MPKVKNRRSTPDSSFNEVVLNAIDFAKRSVAELKRSPKYSMIHFAAAVELFLKARLMKEHWSLVVTRPEIASLPDFRSGKFRSVSMEEAIKRLRNVANEPISDSAERAFRALADHRNRLIHFFHPVLGSSARKREVEEVVTDQFKAWHFLYELVTHSWAVHFKSHVGRLRKLNATLLHLKEFLNAKYDAIAPEIQEQIRKGAIFENCSLCGFQTAKVEAFGSAPELFTGRCLVCGWYHSSIHEPCPDCGQTIVVEDMGDGTCENCNREIDLDYLLEQYVPHYDPKDEEPDTAYCSECERTEAETVIPFGNGYLCLSCQTEFDRVGHCGYCYERITNISSVDSYVFGCIFCGGAAGNDNS
jgi:hypothetical protein